MSVLAHARTLGDVISGQAGERPDKFAFETLDGQSVTFADFDRRVNRLTQALLAKEVAHGDRMAAAAVVLRKELRQQYGAP